MRNVSNAFRNELYNDNRNYIVSCDITFSDGTKKTVTNAQIWSGGFKVEDSVSGSNNFEIGAAIVGKFTLVLNNIYDDYSEYDFYGAEISNVKCGLKLPDETTESVRFGKYTVDEPKYNGSIITLSCLDNMSKFDRPYSESNLTYPATLGQIVRDACNICDVPLASDSATFDNDDYVVDARPDDNTTFREVLSWVGQISCHWLKCNNNGQLSLRWYDRETYDKLFGIYDAGNFNDDIEKDTVDAGTFANPADGDVIDFGTFSDSGKYHHIYSTTSTDMSTDDVTITGIRVTERAPEDAEDQEDIVYQYGEDGYVLGIEGNELIQSGKGSQVASYLGGKIVGLTFRPLSLTCLSDPTIESGDLAIFTDRKGRSYKTLITSTTFQAKNYQKVSCDAESPSKKNASRISKYTKVYQDLKNNLKRQKTAWEQAIEDLDNRLTNSSGLYSTIEKQEDGSNIYYLHDKPTLEESEIVWKMTAEAWGVSTNGGETWNGGMTVDGDVIARILTSIGVNADWINTGALVIQDADGNIMFRADVDTGIVDIIANTLSIRGKTVEEIAQDNLSDYVNEVFDPAIDNLQAQIDGQIETWFYDYVPTTSNAPASQWTTDTEKEKHLGDLFYIVDNEEYGGQAYRWAKINNAYTWDYVEDTATTKALADAAKAQDTADSKRRVFVSTPVPPYDVGDLWVGNSSSELMRCQNARQSGTYVSTDWIKAVKYTDDSALNNFISGDYASTITELQTQADKKAETWYQGTDPSTGWSSTDKQNHKGDLWYNTSDQKTYIYNGSVWEETKSAPPDEVFDQIDGKAQIFISQPVPPYNQGDLWFNSATSDIMTCINARESGSYISSDWQKRNKYTDDSALNNFLSGEYQETIQELKDQADQKSETWYQSNDPAASWSAEEKENHAGDLWYNTGNQNTYIYNGASWQLTKTTPPDEVFDTIDSKAQIFVNQPVPPYAVGDLWFNSATSDIMTCVQKRESGTYNAADWEKRNKYTDDTYAETVEENLNIFSEAVTGNLNNMQEQIDGKIETWYYNYQPTLTNIPASQWTTEEERHRHIGDLFYWQDKGFTYRFQQGSNGYIWQAIQDSDITEALEQAAQAQDTADRKRQVFYSTPYPPYDVGDLWAQGANGDIMRCRTARQSGNYVSTDWEKASKYTDDSALDEFINGEFSNTISDLQEQADKKAETWYQSTDPSTSWTTTAIKNEHVGDIWYNTSSSVQKSYRWNGTSWQEMKTTPPDEVFDQIDGKAQIFISQPVPPYNQGDLWFNSATSDIMTCITSRESGSYVAADWQKRNKYVDQSTVNNAITEYDTSLGQTEVFNKLTNGGQTQGIYIQDGKLYINADYILSGTVAGQRINAKGIRVLDANNNVTFEIDNNGNVTIRANTFSLQGSTIQNIANSAASSAANSALTSANNYTDNKASSTLSSAQSYATNQANNAYNNSKNYTDNQLANFSPDVDLSQREIFNILTNNGQTQGIYLSGGRIYINATYIDTGNLAGWNVNNTTLSSSSGYNSATLDGGNGRVRTTGDYEVYGGPGYAELYGNRVYADMGRFYSLQVDGSCSSLDISGTLYVSSTVTFPSVYNNTSTTTNQVVIGTAGKLFRKSSSSRRYKNHVRNMDFSEANKLYELPVVWFVYKDGYLSDKDRKIGVSIPGFYAEDVDKYLPDAADYIEDKDGNLIPENWDERTLIPYMVKCIQTQHEEIETLKSNQQKILQALSKAGIEVEL